MKLSAAYHGGTRYDITSGKHRIVTDQPVDDGGQDAGMSPVELFVGSVTSCVAYFVGQFCVRHHISCEGLSVDAEWAMAEGPHRVGQINLAIHLPLIDSQAVYNLTRAGELPEHNLGPIVRCGVVRHHTAATVVGNRTTKGC